MGYDTHFHIVDRIICKEETGRERFNCRTGLLADLEEGCRVTQLETPVKLRNEKGNLLGRVKVMATIHGKVSLMDQLPIPFGRLLDMCGIPFVGDPKRPDYKRSVQEELEKRYPYKKSLDYFTFYVYGQPADLKEKDFDMHVHDKNPLVVLPEDLERAKENEIGLVLASGCRTFSFSDGVEMAVEMQKVNHETIGKAFVIGAIQTTVANWSSINNLFDTDSMIQKATGQTMTWLRRELSVLNRNKSDTKWFSLIYFQPQIECPFGENVNEDAE